MTVFWKIAHSLYKVGGVLIPLARIFEFVYFWICVHFKVQFGVNCKILPNVMIGAKFKNGLPDEDVPTIGDNVFIGTGAVIVGKQKQETT